MKTTLEHAKEMLHFAETYDVETDDGQHKALTSLIHGLAQVAAGLAQEVADLRARLDAK